jgi:hypothetical protein
MVTTEYTEYTEIGGSLISGGMPFWAFMDDEDSVAYLYQPSGFRLHPSLHPS